MDWKIRAGRMRGLDGVLPSGTGVDASGVVEEAGAGVESTAIGDAVFGTGQATVAEQAMLTRWTRMPQGPSFEEATGYPCRSLNTTQRKDQNA